MSGDAKTEVVGRAHETLLTRRSFSPPSESYEPREPNTPLVKEYTLNHYVLRPL